MSSSNNFHDGLRVSEGAPSLWKITQLFVGGIVGSTQQQTSVNLFMGVLVLTRYDVVSTPPDAFHSTEALLQRPTR